MRVCKVCHIVDIYLVVPFQAVKIATPSLLKKCEVSGKDAP